MRTAWTIQNAIWALNFLGTALVIWRLFSLGLHKKYRFFFAGFFLALARTAALLPFKTTDPAYFQIWVATQPLLWLSYALIVYELYSLVLLHYPGLRSLGRWFFFIAVGVALGIALLASLPALGASARPGRPQIMYSYVFTEGILTGSLAILLFLLLALMTWFTVPMSRNLLIHCTVYSAYFFAQNVVLLYWRLGGQAANRVNVASGIARMSVALLCYCFWVILLTKQGEERPASLSLGRSPDFERRALGQLEKLNATLLQTAKK
jgi:hypothetical protein